MFFILVCFFQFSEAIFAQAMQISYHQVFENQKATSDKRFDLFITDTVSLYTISDSKLSTKELDEDEDISIQYNYIGLDDKNFKNLYYNNRESFYFITNYSGSELAVQEDNLSLNHTWQYIDSTKTIGSFTCKLATTEFRGRKYWAWYTEEIPTDFGPWKFKNLPGLALQITDDKDQFKLNALEIERIPSNETKKIVSLMRQAYKDIHNKKKLYTITEFQEYRDERTQAMLSRLHQQLPKGSEMPKIESCERCGPLEIF